MHLSGKPYSRVTRHRLLNEYLKKKGATVSDELEEKAREEKTSALKELAESRISVLIGPAGTGKTTLLSVLCSQPEIAKGDVLLIAPTGKVRVRMEQSTEDLKLRGYTIAQFLSPNRYDASTGRYRLSEKPAEAGARTVIIDEASMLTEEMLMEDDVFDKVVRTGKSEHVRFVEWESADDLRSKVIDVLVTELKLNGANDIAEFDRRLGGKDWNEMRFFNFGSAQQAESWQILSPVRSGAHGVPGVNRLIHKRFRRNDRHCSEGKKPQVP